VQELILENYYACEIDKHAIKVTQSNFPKTIQVGDVTKLQANFLPEIDLLMGGSPCQGFSFAGKQLNFNDPRSRLFFEFVRLLKECKPKYFLLENVKMKKESLDIISKNLGVDPVRINSNRFSAQNRDRFYWTNIKIKEIPDKKVVLRDILENTIFYKEPYIENYVSNKPVLYTKAKFNCLRANAGSRTRGIGICDEKGFWRKLTVSECEALQTVPIGYTDCGVSKTQRYKMLGNGWTVDVIAHILKQEL